MKFNIEQSFEGLMQKANPDVQKDSVQYKESRRMFYAGVAALFGHMVELTALPDALGFESLDDIKEQLAKFQKRIGVDA